MRPCEDKVKAMLDMAPPLKHGKVDKRLMQVALGCFNYYRRYVHRFAHISAPLVECTKDGANMDWTPERRQAFDKLKRAMATAPVVMHPDFSLPFTVHTDASKTAVAGVLTQYMTLESLRERCTDFPWASTKRAKTIDGKPAREVVIGFFSKMNSEKDATLSATEQECLAVVLSLNYFRAYIWGRPVTVVTDASALRWLLSLKDTNGKLLRWAMRLQEYDIYVVHKPGKQNNADGPSRLPQMVDILGPRRVEHADENWPDCVDVRPAPPSGVHFQEDEETIDTTASVLRLGTHDYIRGDMPIRLNALAINAIDLAEQLAKLSYGQVYDLLDTEDESVNTDITVLFENGGGEDSAPIQFFEGVQASTAVVLPGADERLGMEPDVEQTSSEPPMAPAMLRREAFIQWQERDAFCAMVKRYLLDKELPDDREDALHILLNKECFQVDADGLVTHFAIDKSKRGEVLRQWLVPMSLRPLLLRLAHDNPSSLHPTVQGTHAKLLQRFYWRGMGDDVRTYVRSCVVCQQSKPQHTARYKQVLMPAERLWQRLHMDHTEIGIISTEGYRYLLNVIDARSGWCWLFPTRTKSAEEVAKHLKTVILEIAACPEELVSDNAKEFKSALVKDLCETFGVEQINTSTYHPQSNGIVENLNGRVKRALQRCRGPREKWPDNVELVQYALRTTAREETGLTPFFCVYGREPRFPFDSYMGAPDGARAMHLEVQRMIDNLKLAEEEIGASLRKRAREIGRRNDKIKHAVKIAVGDYVWLKRPPTPGRAASLDEKFSGPWKVVAQNGDSGLSFQCQLMGSRIRYTTAHVENMKPYIDRPSDLRHEGIDVTLPTDDVLDLPANEQLMRLIDRRAEPDSTWSYKWRRRDGAEIWARETQVVEDLKVSPWVLDTFHALYEIDHNRDMQESAKRPTPSADQRLSRDDALRLYRKGDEVARAVRRSDNQTDYVFGQIHDFVKPRWRVQL
jgi:RNase H-like domain found in reverse transcriptase/Integrase zinc binding domain/Integrase core domain